MKLSKLLSRSVVVPSCIQLVLAYEWVFAGWEKVESGMFPSGLGKTLIAFGAKNPHQWYADNILRSAQDSSQMIGQLVQWGELLAGVGLLLGALFLVFGKTNMHRQAGKILSLIALIGGAFLNANFYLASGWMSPSASGLNALMFWIEIVLGVGLVILP